MHDSIEVPLPSPTPSMTIQRIDTSMSRLTRQRRTGTDLRSIQIFGFLSITTSEIFVRTNQRVLLQYHQSEVIVKQQANYLPGSIIGSAKLRNNIVPSNKASFTQERSQDLAVSAFEDPEHPKRYLLTLRSDLVVIMDEWQNFHVAECSVGELGVP